MFCCIQCKKNNNKKKQLYKQLYSVLKFYICCTNKHPLFKLLYSMPQKNIHIYSNLLHLMHQQTFLGKLSSSMTSQTVCTEIRSVHEHVTPDQCRLSKAHLSSETVLIVISSFYLQAMKLNACISTAKGGNLVITPLKPTIRSPLSHRHSQRFSSRFRADMLCPRAKHRPIG